MVREYAAVQGRTYSLAVQEADMANKRFVKPIRPDVTIPAIRDQATIDANRDVIARDEYRYSLAEAKRQHPEWTLKQRQEYAQQSVASLFE